MASDWPNSIFGFPVRAHHIGKGGVLTPPISIMLHTEEAGTDEAGEVAFEHEPTNASHFAVDADSIIQFRGMHEWAGSLVHAKGVADSPNNHCVQIEIASYSKTTPWSLPEPTLARVAALVAYIAQFHGVPLVVPNPHWYDDCSDMPLPWATTINRRRQWAGQDGHWPNVRGVWEHLEVPNNSHWDCGALNRSVIIKRAQALIGPVFPGYNLKQGMTDPAVGVFFGQLHRRWGWKFGTYLFGNTFGWLKTKACKDFQKSFGHFPSGEVDQKTWEKAWQ